jgi:ABC-type methionine transport system ATPase subunit
LINNPPLLLADEPTGNLDSTTTEEILETFRKLNKEQGITIVIVTHEPDVGAHCDRIIRMRDGRVENDNRATVDHPGTVQSAPQAPDKVELLRMLTAHGKQMGEALDSLSAAEKTELGQLLSAWTSQLPGLSNGQESSTESSRTN